MLRPRTVLLAFALATMPAVALAQTRAPETEDARGYLTAFACGTLPAPLRLHVDVLDNSDQNLRLRDLLVQRLQAKGADISTDATQVLSLEVGVSRQATRLKPGDLIDVRVGRDEPDLGQEGFARLHMNVWSSARDSLLTGRQGRVEEEGFDILRLRASINSRTDGRCLWQGEIVHDLDGSDAYQAAAKLIPLLADSIGQPASRKPIRID